MRTSPPLLLPIFRSGAQAELLARIFLDPRASGVRLTDVAEIAHVPVTTAHREIMRLARAGLVQTVKDGRDRRVAPNRSSPFYPELEALLRKAFGPVSVLRSFLEDVDGVNEAYVYGSWVRRYRGEPGPAPADLDLVVIGSADPDDVYVACAGAEGQLGLSVDATILSREEWARPRSSFVRTIKREPRVQVLPS